MAAMPEELTLALGALLAPYGEEALRRDAQALSERYRGRVGEGARLLTTQREAAAYAASRMPATYAAVARALSLTLPCLPGFAPRSLTDVGAGPGTAAFACAAACPTLGEILCLEREAAMRGVGLALMRAMPAPLSGAAYGEADLSRDEALAQADLVTACYVLGELTPGAMDALLLRLWEAARGVLLLVEPGTPAGAAHLLRARALLLPLGAHIAAPCPTDGPCPHAAEGGEAAEDWCHFAVRVQRTRLHRSLKGGEAPYEDEKFSFLALSRESPRRAAARVLRHPEVHGGHIALTLCTGAGLERRVVTKKDKPAFRAARDAGAGSPFEPAGQ